MMTRNVFAITSVAALILGASFLFRCMSLSNQGSAKPIPTLAPAMSELSRSVTDPQDYQSPPIQCPAGLRQASFSLDGVPLTVCASLLPSEAFIASDPDDLGQVATAVNRDGAFTEFSIIAVPFGIQPPTEALPRAESGASTTYRTLLSEFREQQGGDPQWGPAINLFGEQVIGSYSVVKLNIDGPEKKPVTVAEWVTEAGSRVWIVRVAQELVPNGNAALRDQASAFASSSETISLASTNPDAPSTSLAARNGL